MSDSGFTSMAAGQNCFYGGDFDFRSAVSSDRNTRVSESWVFDDVEWSGGEISRIRAHFVTDRDTGVPVAGDVAIYRGMAEGIWGERVVDIRDATDGLSWLLTGRQHVGRDEYELRFNVRFDLPPGSYHVGVRPVAASSVATGSAGGTNWPFDRLVVSSSDG